jgi:hypothetical protein
MEQTESVLMNFNISPLLKSTFHDYCRYKNTSMTSQLNILIDNFIKKELYELKKQEWMEEQKNLPTDFFSTWFENNPSPEDWY